MFGEAAMSVSSFLVVSNALRMNLFKVHYARKDKKIKSKTAERQHTATQKKTLNIEGMMCGHCEPRVQKALENVDGISQAVVSHESKTAVVTPTKAVPNEVLKQAVEAEDYQVLNIT